MKIINKIIVLCIIIIIIYIFFVFYKKQLHRYRTTEGMTTEDTANAAKEVKGIKIDEKKYIIQFSDKKNSTATGDNDNELKHYCIKGSANSAYSGSYISIDMVKYVLSLGCRFLHFQVFSNDDSPVVGYTSDKTHGVNSASSFEELNVLLPVVISESSSASIPNNEDTLFIYIDVIAEKGTKKKSLYNSINNIINSVDTRVKNKLNQNTSMYVLNKKVVFIFNQEPEISVLGSNANLTIGGNIVEHNYNEINVNTYKATPAKPSGKNKTNKKTLDILLPTPNINEQKNPNIFDTIGKYGINICMMQYYNKDDYLLNNEIMFKHYNSGIIPLATAINYVKIYGFDKKENQKQLVFPTFIQ